MTSRDVIARGRILCWTILILTVPGINHTTFAERLQSDHQASPNIVLILADDMGYGDPRCYNPDSKCVTPHIDQLADLGMRFMDAHAAGSVCVPSRYGLLTGQYPFRKSLNPNREAVIDAQQLTVPAMLRQQGYTTSMVGKWHQGFDGGDKFDYSKPLRGGPVDRGFDRFFGMHASLDIPPYFYIRNDQATRPASEHVADSNSEGWSPIQGAFWRKGDVAPDFKHNEVLDRFADEAVSEVERLRQQDKPYFLYVALPAPHTPWLPAEQFRNRGGAGLYSEFVAHVDHVVGRIAEPLLTQNENTLIIFSSDNGPVWYDEDEQRFGHDSAGPLRGMKGDVWEGGHRMPFIVTWPGHVATGETCNHLIGFVDLLATLAELTNAQNVDPADGVSFLSSLTNPHGTGQRTTMIQHHAGKVVRRGQWKLINQRGSGGFSRPKKGEAGTTDPPGQLYRLDNDLSESTNLWQTEPERVKELLQLLQMEAK